MFWYRLRDATRLCAPEIYGNAMAWMYWCWWNLSCRRRCCLIYVQFPWGRTGMWTDDEDRDERCGDWRWRPAAWWHRLRDASEKFAVCIFKVESNPEGQQVLVPSKLLRTFYHILRQWSKKNTESNTFQEFSWSVQWHFAAYFDFNFHSFF